MSMLLTFIASHLLTILENLLVQEEPVILDMVEKEARLLINKIEALLDASKSNLNKPVKIQLAAMQYAKDGQNG